MPGQTSMWSRLYLKKERVEVVTAEFEEFLFT